eukprot:s6658_g1.t1
MLEACRYGDHSDECLLKSETPVVPLLRGKSSMGPKHNARVAVDRVASVTHGARLKRCCLPSLEAKVRVSGEIQACGWRTTVCCWLGFAADGTSEQQSIMDSFQQYVGEFRHLAKRPRSFLIQVLNLGCIVFSALMLWKGL